MSGSERPLARMFATVPGRYDLVNRIMTLGLDQPWRRLAVAEALEHEPRRVLDLCTGTGDLALALASKANVLTTVFGLDFSAPMLAAAARKAQGRVRVALALGDAARLPLPDGSLDAVTIGFGLRNLTWRNPNRDRHLAEILRVLRPGGRLVAVESSQPTNLVVRLGFRLYLRGVVGPLGSLVSGQPGAYGYLARSAADFFAPEALADLLRSAGFAEVRYRRLLGGAAAVHVALRAG